jgi:hypothetical protein
MVLKAQLRAFIEVRCAAYTIHLLCGRLQCVSELGAALQASCQLRVLCASTVKAEVDDGLVLIE